MGILKRNARNRHQSFLTSIKCRKEARGALGGAPRKKRGNSPVQDKEALGRMAGALGQSRLSQNMNQLAKAVNSGSLPVTPETEAEIKEACREIAEMRAALLAALGKAPGSEP